MSASKSKSTHPERLATVQDVEDWLANGCRPAEKSYQRWLCEALTAEYAYTGPILDAVFGLGKFVFWNGSPPELQDDCYHWCEIVDESEEHPSLESAKHNTQARERALRLLTMWLGTDTNVHDDRTQAQRIAAKLFKQAKQKLSNTHDLKSKGKAEILKELGTEESKADSASQQIILEELCIFLIVDEIFVDFRMLTSVPRNPEDLRLPIWETAEIRNDWECWWWNYGWHIIEAAVPWYGRGGTAKVALLLHSLVASLYKANDPNKLKQADNDSGPFDTYGYVDIWSEVLIFEMEPLALEVSATQIEALARFVKYDGGIYESQDGSLKEYIVPPLKSILDKSTTVRSTQQATPEETLQDLLKRVAERYDHETAITEAHRVLSHAANNPLECVPDPYEYIEKGVQAIERYYEERKRRKNYNYDVECLDLSGKRSKCDLLRTALEYPGLKVLDLENCFSDLDESILDAMAKCLERLETVLLSGTAIPQTSSIVAKLRERGCLVDFSGERCRSCGFHNPKRHLETDETSELHRLRQENASLRRRIEELTATDASKSSSLKRSKRKR